MRDFKVYQASGYLTKLVADASDVRKEYEEISGSLVQFDTPISAPLASLMVDINLVQSGTGDPSPTNVRPITGWTGCNVWVKPEYDTSLPATASVTFPDTVYGGSHEFVSGESIKTHNRLILKDLPWSVYLPLNNGGCRFVAYPFTSESVYPKTGVALSQNISNVFSYINPNTFNADTPYYKFGVYSSGTNRFVQISHPAETVEDLITSLTELDAIIVYELETPTEIQITPQVINALQGVNNIWADTGDVSVKYRTH